MQKVSLSESLEQRQTLSNRQPGRISQPQQHQISSTEFEIIVTVVLDGDYLRSLILLILSESLLSRNMLHLIIPFLPCPTIFELERFSAAK
jgi:hypothetical protein